MGINEVLLKVKGGSLDALLPLEKIVTQEDKNEYIQLGYNVGFTLDEFKERFPNLNSSYIFYDNFDLIPSIVYYEEEILFYTKIECIIGKEVFMFSNKKGEDEASYIERFIRTRRNYALEKKYEISFSFAPDSIRCQLLSKLMDRMESQNLNIDIYNIFISVYSSSEFGAYNISNRNLINLKKCKSIEQSNQLKESLKDLPNIVTIYRGEGDKSTNYKKAISWTLNVNIANFFAIRNTPSFAYVYTAQIPKEKIIAYINSRDEEEVLVDFNDIKIIKKTKLNSIKQYSSTIEKVVYDFNFYKNYLKECNFSNPNSACHEKIHCLRVLLLALIIAKKLRLKDKNINLLAIACIFHDAGRINDDIDEKHGLYSYNIFKERIGAKNEEAEILKFLMEYHCKDDNLALKYLEDNNIKDKKNVWLMYKILKDADALDRVRFGVRSLDVNYLRLKESNKLLLVAQECLVNLKL